MDELRLLLPNITSFKPPLIFEFKTQATSVSLFGDVDPQRLVVLYLNAKEWAGSESDVGLGRFNSRLSQKNGDIKNRHCARNDFLLK
ncbi:hypothetical protein WI73_12080 [Burkholderia ubonensis]|nr:hypothetical protein WI73_12080 [Burkholderia ubonensis]